MVYDQLYSYLIGNGLLNKCQSDFRFLHSTVTALLDAQTNGTVTNIDNNLITAVVFLALTSKAVTQSTIMFYFRALTFMGLIKTLSHGFIHVKEILCAPVFIFTSGSSALSGHPGCGLSI